MGSEHDCDLVRGKLPDRHACRKESLQKTKSGCGNTDKGKATADQQQHPKLARFRWLWFAAAALLALSTPGAIASAIHLAQTDHRLVLVAILALTMRIGWIWLFLWLWWKYRSTTQP
jgi:hypothetical protein